MSRIQEAFDYVMVTDWRGILRPIRDGLDNIRDRLPGAGSETPEDKRRKQNQRSLDGLRGFAYFDSFEELQGWTADQVDPLQRSTIPLITRPDVLHRQKRGETKKARIMVCHDYAGGYHAYESSSSNTVKRKDFTLSYLSHVEIFIYFSHHLVTIPPPTWTNTLHRNGVLSLGTFIIEHRVTGRDNTLHFDATEHGRVYPVAKALANMAIEYGFDGWLINIEQAFNSTSWKLAAMNGFLLQLRDLMGPSRRIVWYDALTTDDKVQHQNALNSSNGLFFEACDDIIINYTWNQESLHLSLEFAAENNYDTKRMYFGVDVWAQNQPQDLLHPRITYPSNRGGGTNTGLAVQECARQGVSACIFGPAWTYEHFKSYGDAIEADNTMWDGKLLPIGIECHCYPDQPAMKGDHLSAGIDASITRHATRYPAGSDQFFWTDFQTSFSREKGATSPDTSNTNRMTAHLGKQSVLPVSWYDHTYFSITDMWCKFDDSRPGMLSIGVPAHRRATMPIKWALTLFDTQLKVPLEPADQALELSITYERTQKLWTPILCLYFSDDSQLQTELPSSDCCTKTIVVPQSKTERDGTICVTTIGVMVSNDDLLHESYPPECFCTEILRLYNLSLMLRDVRRPDDFQVVPLRGSDSPAAINIRGSERSSNVHGVPLHVRISWDINECAMRGPDDGLHHPNSHITGAMSHFEVLIDGEYVDRVYGLEMVLPQRFMAAWSKNENLEIRIDCVRFGGLVYVGTGFKLSKSDAEWEVV